MSTSRLKSNASPHANIRSSPHCPRTPSRPPPEQSARAPPSACARKAEWLPQLRTAQKKRNQRARYSALRPSPARATAVDRERTALRCLCECAPVRCRLADDSTPPRCRKCGRAMNVAMSRHRGHRDSTSIGSNHLQARRRIEEESRAREERSETAAHTDGAGAEGQRRRPPGAHAMSAAATEAKKPSE